MMIQQATPNVTPYFKAHARNGKMGPRIICHFGFFELFRQFYGTEEYSGVAKIFRRVCTTFVADQNA